MTGSAPVNAPLHACSSRMTRRFAVGRHTIVVQAVSSAGLADPTPAVLHFRVKRVS